MDDINTIYNVVLLAITTYLRINNSTSMRRFTVERHGDAGKKRAYKLFNLLTTSNLYDGSCLRLLNSYLNRSLPCKCIVKHSRDCVNAGADHEKSLRTIVRKYCALAMLEQIDYENNYNPKENINHRIPINDDLKKHGFRAEIVNEINSYIAPINKTKIYDAYISEHNYTSSLTVLKSIPNTTDFFSSVNRRKTLYGHYMAVNHLINLPGNRIASASRDQTIKIWNIDNGNLIRTLNGHNREVNHLINLSRNRIASASTNGTIKIWNIDNGNLIGTLNGHQWEVNHLINLPGNRIASASAGGTIEICNIDNGNLIRILHGHHMGVNHLINLPGNRIASGSRDQTIKIWNIDNGNLIRTLNGHQLWADYLINLPGNKIASTSLDNTIKIWNIDNGNLIRTLNGHNRGVNHLINLPGNRIASASQDGIIKIW